MVAYVLQIVAVRDVASKNAKFTVTGFTAVTTLPTDLTYYCRYNYWYDNHLRDRVFLFLHWLLLRGIYRQNKKKVRSQLTGVKTENERAQIMKW
jgi:hypothetical protein